MTELPPLRRMNPRTVIRHLAETLGVAEPPPLRRMSESHAVRDVCVAARVEPPRWDRAMDVAVAAGRLEREHVSGGGVAPEWVPEGATTFADFVTAHYWDGVTIVVDPSGMFQSDDVDGDPWIPENIVPGTGYFSESGEAGASYKGQALASVGTEFVYVVELNLTTGTSGRYFSIAYDGSFEDGHTFLNTSVGLSASHVFDKDNSHIASDEGEGVLVAGINRIAFRLAEDKLSISVNGRTTVSVNDPVHPTTISMFTVYTESPDCIIRSLTTYPNSTLDADLPALTAMVA